MKYKCVLSDLDGTLLKSDKTISLESRSIIEKLIEKGIPFVPVTGRAYFAISEEVLSLKGLQYVVANNGVAIYDVRNQRAIHNLFLPEEFIAKIARLLADYSVAFECFYKGRPYTSEESYNNPDFAHGNKIRNEYIRSTRTPVKDIMLFMSEHANELDGIDITVSPEEKDEIRRLIEQHCSGIYITSSEKDLIEISSADSGKNKGVKNLCDILGISMSEMVAFGDNDNDIEMLSEVGLGIAVGNATDSCKEVADRIVVTSDEDGVANTIRDLFADI